MSDVIIFYDDFFAVFNSAWFIISTTLSEILTAAWTCWRLKALRSIKNISLRSVIVTVASSEISPASVNI